MTITPEQLARWRVLCEASSPGPWTPWAGEGVPEAWAEMLGCEPSLGWPIRDASANTGDPALAVAAVPVDQAFIATARTALPLLLDEVGRLRADNVLLIGALVRVMGQDLALALLDPTNKGKR